MHDDSSASPPKSAPPSKPAQPARRIPLGLLAGFTAVAFAAGGGVAWWTWRSAPAPIAQSAQAPAPNLQAAQEQTVQVYWLKRVDNQIELAAAPVQIQAEPNDLLQAAFQQVLQKPADPSFTSAIPEQTILRSLEVKSDCIHVDLSSEFTTGGGSAAMMGRLGQVVYTATTLDPSARVWLTIEGKPLEVLGGEGLLIEQPMTRDRFQQDFQLQLVRLRASKNLSC